MTDWRVAYLRALGAKPTDANLAFLSKWQPFEGGHTNNNARFNYFNTTKKMPGSSGINSVGVQSYKTLAQGAQAFAKTLTAMPQYAGLVNELRAGTGVGSGGAAALSTWLTGDPSSAQGLAYAQKILGSSYSSSAPADDAPTPAAAPQGVSLPEPDVQAQNAATIRQRAQENLRGIVSGEMKPTDSLADIGSLAKTLHASIPKVQVIPDAAGAGQGGGDNTGLEQQAVALAHKYLGVKYTWGGESAKTGFDCSGLVQNIWKSLGVDIPRTTYEQFKTGKKVSIKGLRPGDAVFFHPGPNGPEHEALYIGNGKIIAAPHTGTVVQVQSLADLIQSSKFAGARRFS